MYNAYVHVHVRGPGSIPGGCRFFTVQNIPKSFHHVHMHVYTLYMYMYMYVHIQCIMGHVHVHVHIGMYYHVPVDVR